MEYPVLKQGTTQEVTYLKINIDGAFFSNKKLVAGDL
jgi:hypothetical protein